MQERLRLEGVTAPVVAITVSSSSGNRGEEIMTTVHQLDIDDFLVLDDEVSDMGLVRNLCYQTDMTTGLTMPDVTGVLKLAGERYLPHSRRAP
jgi:hypothetical protein